MTSNAPVLYLGDTSLTSAASYLAGVMQYISMDFDYVDSETPLTVDNLSGKKLIILSDYPSIRINPTCMQILCNMLDNGCALLCLGGWESFQGWHGTKGGYANSKLAAYLPVEIANQDDRINFDQAAIVYPADTYDTHKIVKELPWDDRPPTIGGYNLLTPKANAIVLLEVTRFGLRRSGYSKNQSPDYALEPITTDPLLVINRHPHSKIACLATDAAPHWIGPMVDWGTCNNIPSGSGRILIQSDKSETIEVGYLYVQFFQQLLSWCIS